MSPRHNTQQLPGYSQKRTVASDSEAFRWGASISNLVRNTKQGSELPLETHAPGSKGSNAMKTYLVEDLQQIQRYFPGAKAITLEVPFEFTERPLRINLHGLDTDEEIGYAWGEEAII